MALAVLMHSKWTMASDHAHRIAATDLPRKRAHGAGAGPVPISIKYRAKRPHPHSRPSPSSSSSPSSCSPPHHNHNHRPTAAAAPTRLHIKDDPVRDGVRLAYDDDARLPSDRRANMITVGGDLSEGVAQWDGEGDIRLGDIVHDDDAEPAYTVAFAQRRRGRAKRKSGGGAVKAEGADHNGSGGDLDGYDVMDDGWESDDDAAISLADGWAEMESWRDPTRRAGPVIGA